ncbi:hypothetical protein [Nonlabens dokdonensis]|nr:hypothetical protein [Nonlabens dokdonensis]
MKLIYYISFLIIGFFSSAQIGINTNDPDAAAALDINAQNTINFGGLAIPVVSETQRNTIAVTASSEGTMLFVTYASGDRCLEIYDGIQDTWQKINCLTIGPLILWQQDFDTNTTWNYSSDVSFFDNGSDGFYGITTTLPFYSSTIMQNDFVGIDDLNDEGNGTSGFATLTFDTVAVSGNNISIQFDYDIQEWDNNDDVYYTAVVDGVDQTEVFFFDGIGDLSANGTEIISVPNGTSTVGFRIRFRQNGPDRGGFDNFRVVRN